MRERKRDWRKGEYWHEIEGKMGEEENMGMRVKEKG